MIMNIDLHVHTSASPCSHFAPIELVYYAKLENHPVIITTNHHDSYSDVDFLRSELGAAGILYFPAIEVTCDWGDFLLYGEDLSDLRGPFETFPSHLLPRPGIAVVWAHPYEFVSDSFVERIMDQAAPFVDAIEVLNGKCRAKKDNSANEKALALAQKLGKPGVAGSDAHSPHRFFDTWTEFLQPVTCYTDLVRCIKKGSVALPPLPLHDGAK